jgi:hypothetical protein
MNSIKTIVSVVVALLVLGGGVYVYMDMVEQEKIAEEKKAAEQRAAQEKAAAEQALAARTKCGIFGNYFAVTFDHESAVGQDILVRDTAGAEAACTFAVAEGDFSLVNSDPQYLKGVAGKAVVVDVGTGPSGRSLRIYDLTDKSLVTEKQYFGEMKIASTTLTYLGLAKEKASKKNCKEYDELTKDGGTANLVVEKNVNLETYSVKEGKTTKCVGGQ